jgi:PhnB protein
MKSHPYLDFNGRCEEALTFYRDALGAEIGAMMRFTDSPDPSSVTPGTENKILHANFSIGESMLMASDGRCEGTPKFAGVSLTLEVGTVADAGRVFAALSDGGKVLAPLCETFFSPSFGMVADRFGVTWMVLATAA